MEIAKIILPALLVLGLMVVPLQSFADTTIYSVVIPRSDVDILRNYHAGTGNSGADILVGEEVKTGSSLINQAFNRIIIPLEKEDDGSTLVGTIYAGVWSSTVTPTANNRLKACGSMEANTVSDGLTYYTFSCGTNSWTLSVNQVVGVFYNDSTTLNKFGIFMSTKGSTFNGTNTSLSCYSSSDPVTACGADTGSANSWVDSPTIDLIMNLTLVVNAGSGQSNFCAQPENADILICRNGGNGEAGSAGAFIIGNVSQGTGIVGIGCNLGFVDCVSNPDIKTNGLGLLIFTASIFVVVGMFYYLAGRHAFEMPVFIWILIIIALSAFFTITQVIDPVFLIISIVVIVALAAPKVLGALRGNTFGGGSTE